MNACLTLLSLPYLISYLFYSALFSGRPSSPLWAPDVSHSPRRSAIVRGETMFSQTRCSGIISENRYQSVCRWRIDLFTSKWVTNLHFLYQAIAISTLRVSATYDCERVQGINNCFMLKWKLKNVTAITNYKLELLLEFESIKVKGLIHRYLVPYWGNWD